MNKDRREFIRTAGIIGTAVPALMISPFKSEIYASEQSQQPIIEDDENYWAWIRQSYTASPNIINLNNGGVSPQPKFVQDTLDNYNRLCNEAPSYYMWQILDQGREPLRSRLASFAGCSVDEIAINRNTTEALDNIIFGLDLAEGDEVVLTKQDYPNVINAWKQRELRDKIKIKWVNLNLPDEDEERIVSQFTAEFNSRTKAVNITHMINWTGQILPARRIADEAHKKGIEVIVDAAHTFAHIDFKIPDLDCDYLGTSLHKWMCAPFGSGLLYIKKEKISKIWPMFPQADPKSGDIRKFEAMGTRSFPIEMAIGQALNFHMGIGTPRKENRLRSLRNYWVEKAQKLERFKLNTPLGNKFSCALANFSIEGMKPGDVVKFLFEKYKIHSTPIEWENISGTRITPHIYTAFYELDRLNEALEKLVRS